MYNVCSYLFCSLNCSLRKDHSCSILSRGSVCKGSISEPKISAHANLVCSNGGSSIITDTIFQTYTNSVYSNSPAQSPRSPMDAGSSIADSNPTNLLIVTEHILELGPPSMGTSTTEYDRIVRVLDASHCATIVIHCTHQGDEQLFVAVARLGFERGFDFGAVLNGPDVQNALRQTFFIEVFGPVERIAFVSYTANRLRNRGVPVKARIIPRQLTTEMTWNLRIAPTGSINLESANLLVVQRFIEGVEHA